MDWNRIQQEEIVLSLSCVVIMCYCKNAFKLFFQLLLQRFFVSSNFLFLKPIPMPQVLALNRCAFAIISLALFFLYCIFFWPFLCTHSFQLLVTTILIGLIFLQLNNDLLYSLNKHLLWWIMNQTLLSFLLFSPVSLVKHNCNLHFEYSFFK